MTLTEIQQIRDVLGKLHSVWSRYDGDWHHKQAEGVVEIYYPNWFKSGGTYEKYVTVEPTVGIYSYIFGENRWHDFDSLSDAIVAVKRWAKEYCSLLQEDYDLCPECGREFNNHTEVCMVGELMG